MIDDFLTNEKEEKKDDSAKKDDDASVKKEEETAEAEPKVDNMEEIKKMLQDIKQSNQGIKPGRKKKSTKRLIAAILISSLIITGLSVVLAAAVANVLPVVSVTSAMRTVALISLIPDGILALGLTKYYKGRIIPEKITTAVKKGIKNAAKKSFKKIKGLFKSKSKKDNSNTVMDEEQKIAPIINEALKSANVSEPVNTTDEPELTQEMPEAVNTTEEPEATQEAQELNNDAEEPVTPYETSDSESISEVTPEIPEEPVAEPIENTPVPEWKKLRSREIDEQLSSLNNNGGYTGNYDETEIERRNIVEEELKKINRQLAELSNDGGYTGNYDETEIERQQLLERKRKLESFVNGGLNAPIMQKTVIDDVRTRPHINNHEQIDRPVEQAPEVSEAMPTSKETQVENANVQEPTSMRYHDIYKGMNRSQLQENSRTAEELIAMAVQKINDPTTSEADKQELIGYINELRYEQGIIDERDNALGDSENLGRGRRQ